MRYVIGIDGGGSKSTLKICSEDGVEIGGAIGGPTNISAQPAGNIQKQLNDLISRAIGNAGLHLEDCTAICMGTAGADRQHQSIILRDIIQGIGIKGKIIVKNDAEIALAAGTGKQEGIIVIAGTGSIAYGKTRCGKMYRAGGWGHIVGDEGSAYYIGVKALNAALKSYDGREQPTLLLPLLMQEINTDTVDGIIEYVYSNSGCKSKIAILATIVDTALRKNDRVAEKILSDASHEIFLLADAVIKRLEFKETHTILVASGSVLLKNDFVFGNLLKRVKETYPHITVTKLARDAAWGAVEIALECM